MKWLVDKMVHADWLNLRELMLDNDYDGIRNFNPQPYSDCEDDEDSEPILRKKKYFRKKHAGSSDSDEGEFVVCIYCSYG